MFRSLNALFVSLVALSLVAAPGFSQDDAVKTTAVAPVAVAGVTAVGKPYTGVLIDTRSLPAVQRSLCAAIFEAAPEGAATEEKKVYPDITHLPTATECQEIGIVRYYVSEEAAKKGILGDNPLIIRAVATRGYGNDMVVISAEDAAKLAKLDKEIGFSKTWKVGFLMPEGR